MNYIDKLNELIRNPEVKWKIVTTVKYYCKGILVYSNKQKGEIMYVCRKGKSY